VSGLRATGVKLREDIKLSFENQTTLYSFFNFVNRAATSVLEIFRLRTPDTLSESSLNCFPVLEVSEDQEEASLMLIAASFRQIVN